MKKNISILVLTLMMAVGHAQGVIELKEATLSYNPATYDIVEKGNLFAVNIKEHARGEFEKNPLSFMQKNFNIQHLINKVGDRGFDSYHVTFRSRKGELNAQFDKSGSLLTTYLKFKNVLVPYELQHKLYKDYKGWEMVKNQHIAKGKDGVILTDFYRITMKKGNKSINLKIDTADIDNSEVASN